MDDEEEIGPDLSPPDAIIRLASAQHRFRCPDMAKGQRVSFVRSFKTSGSHPKTKQATSKVRENRMERHDRDQADYSRLNSKKSVFFYCILSIDFANSMFDLIGSGSEEFACRGYRRCEERDRVNKRKYFPTRKRVHSTHPSASCYV